METWVIITISLCTATILKALFNHVFTSRKSTHNLPPTPFTFPIILTLYFLRKSFTEQERFVVGLHKKLGPVIRIGVRPAVLVFERSLIHQALVQNGAVFADRAAAPMTRKIITSNQQTINTAFYGPTWRALRSNLSSEMLNLSRIKAHTPARKWVLDILKRDLKAADGEAVVAVNHLSYALFSLQALMCFGGEFDEKKIREIEAIQRTVILNIEVFNVFLNIWPKVTRILFHKKWKQILQLRKDQEDLLIPLIRARKELKDERKEDQEEGIVTYVDTLLDLELPEQKRKLDEGEIVSMCSEFLNAGADTITAALHWTMANLVKYPHIQEKLFMEIKRVVGNEEEAKEDDLKKMPYVKAVVLEGLRRHPPTHFLVPHRVTQDVTLNNYLVPREGTVNFYIAGMGWDPKVWEDPMAFRPERFFNDDGGEEVFDITGRKEIKMIPFGAGRRMCPAYQLAILELQYFVANLILSFEWKAMDGDDIDLSEKAEFAIVMKNPLKAHVYPRVR